MYQLPLWLLLLTLFLAACANQDGPGGTARDDRLTPSPASGGVVAEGVFAAPTLTRAPESTATGPSSPTPAGSESEATVTATSSPVPPPLKELVVCLASEPESLYLYGYDGNGPAAVAANHVAQALYENLYTTLAYEYQAQGLASLPTQADGNVVINIVTVNAGELVVNAAGEVVQLTPGETLRNAEGLIQTYDGAALLPLPQMVVDFTFKPLVWSDGTPFTAEDSVFSFEVAADTATPGDKSKIQRTAAYEATGELTVRWTGLPGFVDPAYLTNVWPPLPRHELAGFTPAELLEAESANRAPLSTGPFVLESWTAGEEIRLVANPHYYRAGEGLPRLDGVRYRFLPEGMAPAAWLGGVYCDVATADLLAPDPSIILAGNGPPSPDAYAAGNLVAYPQPSLVFEHIAFGINPVADYAEDKPDWFEDARVRQAMTMCTDRERMVSELILVGMEEVLAGGEMAELSADLVAHAYIPDEHPLYPEDAAAYPYDPAAANALLDQAGYTDSDGDGVREAIGSTTPFSVTLGTESESPLRLQLARIFEENMRDCGIVVALTDLPAAIWYSPGPSGPLFGRRFDLAHFAWLSNNRPPCNLYLSENITGPEEEGFGGWSNVNTTGWASEAFDTACRVALQALPGTAAYDENHRQALHIFSQEVPIIPLFWRLKMAAARPEVLNFSPAPSQSSELWNVYELDLAE